MPLPRAQASQGFTLIELLIVMVIIGMLATLMGYSVIQWSQKARLNEAANIVLSDLRQARSRAQLTSQGSLVALCATATVSCATSSAAPTKTYTTSWGATAAGGTGSTRTLPYQITIAPAVATGGGDYPISVSYSAPYAETSATGTIWQLKSPNGSQIFIRVVGVTGKVSISATAN